MKRKALFVIAGLFSVLLLINFGYASPDAAQAAEETAKTGIESGSWFSILPPLVAIGIALIFRQVLFALFLGIWCGAFLAGDLSFGGIFTSFFTALDGYIVPATADESHMSIIIFTILIGGMVGIITDNGGTRGVIERITKYVRTKVRGQLMTSLMGFVVFFDDYANTMVVGSTMRPLTDKLRISRAKLAYLVDATAAPVATIALVSTWIGAMVGFIADASEKMPNFTESAYAVFLSSLPYNFYAFFTLLFVILIAWSGRDFSTMLKARINLYKAKHNPELDTYNLWKDKIEDDEKTKKVSHWSNAVIPIIALVVGTVGGLFLTGEGSSVQAIIESADSYKALLWGSLISVTVAIIMTLSRKLLEVDEMLEGMMEGMHTMFDGLLILVLAWALSALTVELGTADYLMSVFGETLNPYWLPAIVFILSALTAFATGSSWGTMGILMPLVVPLAWEIGNNTGLDYAITAEIIYASVSSVLAGSVWGDHCSPISDTTILSSIATQCDHVEHVNTQLPYAMIVGTISIVSLIAIMVLGVPAWVIYPAGVAVIVAIIFQFGKTPNPEEYTPKGKEAANTTLD
ncbi:sodium:proton antiporter [Aliifodinibius salipaludis]|uniref:Sodium:proton antiporter n=1 Tax=Fodinibius salipaludis TaxID=2032627 RepID=A0A2A2GAU6_9BACT|nr:Na+/H+ antiporter NhaC family protein [Aliifodinibius salipaludis]PAU94458.1 sodium:proton antiporter [Aliifodinibius salipaludis]